MQVDTGLSNDHTWDEEGENKANVTWTKSGQSTGGCSSGERGGT